MLAAAARQTIAASADSFPIFMVPPGFDSAIPSMGDFRAIVNEDANGIHPRLAP
jgi:hypothetical protein